ncbi:MAG: DUF448 domain-containing protein [Pseudomonadota bacterium]
MPTLATGPAPSADRTTRTCVVTGKALARSTMVRFVRGPGGEIVADLAEKLPGRGVWVSASRQHLETAHTRGTFKKGFKTGDIHIQGDVSVWIDQIADLQKARCLNLIGLARRGGALITGFESVRGHLRGLTAASVGGPYRTVLVVADDAAADSRAKLTRLAEHLNVPISDHFTGTALADAAGLDQARFMAVVTAPGAKGQPPPLAHRFHTEVTKYQTLRHPDTKPR